MKHPPEYSPRENRVQLPHFIFILSQIYYLIAVSEVVQGTTLLYLKPIMKDIGIKFTLQDG